MTHIIAGLIIWAARDPMCAYTYARAQNQLAISRVLLHF